MSDNSTDREEMSDDSTAKVEKLLKSVSITICKQMVVFILGSFVVLFLVQHGHMRIKFARQRYRATVDSAVLAALDLTSSKPPNSTSALQYDLSVDLSMRNHDTFNVWYSEIVAVPFYNGSMLSVPVKWPHTPVGRGRPKNRVAWQKIAFQGTVAVSPAVAAELEREQAAGTVHVQLRVSVTLKLKFNIFRFGPFTVYGAYNCWLWFPTPQHGTPAVFDAGTRCWPLH